MTKANWIELTGKQQWDVLVALRGPDCQHSEGIKWLTTAVLRWAMHPVMRVGGTLNDSFKGVVVPYDSGAVDKTIRANQGGEKVMSWSPQHFFGHVCEAASVLGLPIHVIPNEVYFSVVKESMNHYVVLKLWKWARDEGNQLRLTAALVDHIKYMTGRDPEVVWSAMASTTKEEHQHAVSGEQQG